MGFSTCGSSEEKQDKDEELGKFHTSDRAGDLSAAKSDKQYSKHGVHPSLYLFCHLSASFFTPTIKMLENTSPVDAQN